MHLPPLPLSGDRTCLRQSSPRKREFLRFGLETFGNFSPRLPIFGVQRLWTIARKACNIRYFQPLRAHPLRLSDWLAGDAVLFVPVSRRIPCKQGILQGIWDFGSSETGYRPQNAEM